MSLFKDAKVVAHIAGPSGSGKTTLLESLAKKYIKKDLDEFDEESLNQMFQNHKTEDDLSLENQMKEKQNLLNNFLDKNKHEDVVLAGHHYQDFGKLKLEIPTDKKILLDTGPLKSAWRNYRRSKNHKGYEQTFLDIPKNYMQARDDRSLVKNFGYKEMSSKEIQDLLNKEAEENIEPERKSFLKTQLLPHQQRVVDKIKTKPGLLVYHGVGKGKSLGSLAALDSLGQSATVVTPAALKTNYLKEQDKHMSQKLPIDMDSLENIARKQTTKANPALVVDESHRLRDPASKSLQALKKINKNVEKTILMTGTPMVNSPADIASQINLVSHQNLLPENKSEFEKKYVFNKTVNPSFWQSLKGIKPGEVPVLNRKEKGNLQKIFSDWVDYEKGSTDEFPSVEEQEIKVPMAKSQLAIYDTLMNQAPPWVAAKIRSNLPPNKQESQQLNAYLQAARQVANTTAPFIQKGKAESPKVQKAFEELQKVMNTNPNAKAVIYSNYLKAGLDPYKELLTQNKIPFGEFTGSVPQKDRDQMITDYNEGKLKALLLSSAGQQGLDLKNTSLVQLLESGWNEPSLEQAKARAIRYMSHSSLPPEQRKVLVQKFLSTRPETLSQRLGLSDKEYAVDEYLQNLSKNKANLISQFEDLMKPQQVQQKIASLKPVSLSNSLKEVIKAARRNGFKGQNLNPNKFHFKKVAKIEDKVLQFNDTKDYKFLFNNLNSPKFRKLLKEHSEDERFKNFVNNMGKHLSRRGEKIEINSESKPNKTYEVKKYKDDSYSCSCPSYQYNFSTINGDCKHIVSIKNQAAKSI